MTSLYHWALNEMSGDDQVIVYIPGQCAAQYWEKDTLPKDWKDSFNHPENFKLMSINEAVALEITL